MRSFLRPPLLVAAVLLFFVVPSFVDFYTEWLWFQETGYTGIFFKSLTTRGLSGAIGFLMAFVLLYGNIWIALRALQQPYFLIGPTTADIRPIVVDRKQVRTLAGLAAGGVSLLFGLFASSQWLTWLRALNATSFDEVDPILGNDVGFYIFRLPLLELVHGVLLMVVVLSLAACAVVYFLAGAVSMDPRRGLVLRPPARRHLSLLAAGFLVLLAFGAYLNIPQLLLGQGTVIDGASYVDVEARLPVLRILTGAAVVGVLLAIYHAFSSASWPIFAAGGLYLLVSIGGAGYAALIQRLVLAPNEQTKETPFIVHNIAATRKAFALDRVEEREFSGDAALTRSDIEANADTLANVRLWDHQPLLDTFGQIQEIRTYYDFVSVDNDRYKIDGKYRQIMLSARELNSASLPNRSWINERLVFTHGYGLALGPVNEVTQEGLPVLFIKNIPPESSVPLEVKEPSIYFGELSNDHVFVKTAAREFHYPKGEDNVYSEYHGDGGVPVGGFFGKVLFSLRFRSFKTLLSNDIKPESRIIFHRNLIERLTTIAPFLDYDPDPYLVIADGRLFWICDAYTTTSRYPYSTQSETGINYIRNSVKAVIDAYDGRTTFYLADPADPMAATFGRMFPSLFQPIEKMPASLREHIRYPEGIFALQTAMYSIYHMTNPAVFYNKEDQWEVPTLEAEGNAQEMQPYYTIMKLPGETGEEFIQMLPFTPRRKDNLSAWMVARSDAEHYGRLMVFQFPKQKVIFGPRQVVARINQDQSISPQITLWNQQGSQVIWGNLLVIPIEESLLYVRPLYLRSAGGRIPELKRVIVAYQNQIVMEESLSGAISRLFGAGNRPQPAAPGAAPPPPGGPSTPPPQPDDTSLAAQANAHYRRALQAQREGNWSVYGEEIRQVGEILDRMARQPN